MRENCVSFHWKEREREKSGQQKGGHGTNDDLPSSKVLLFAGTSSLGGIVRWMTKRAGSRSTPPVFFFFLRLHAMMMKTMIQTRSRDHI